MTTERIYLRLRQGTDFSFSLEQFSEGNGSWVDFDRVEHDDVTEVCVFVPGHLVWNGVLEIPKAIRKQPAAVAYAAEDLIAGDVEDLHLTWHGLSGSQCRLLAIAHSQLQSIIAYLQEKQVNPDVLLPEYFLADHEDGVFSVHLEGERAHVCTQTGKWVTVQASEVPTLVAVSVAPEEPLQVRLTGESDTFDLLAGQLESLPGVALERTRRDAGDSMESAVRDFANLNLLCRDYAVKKRGKSADWKTGLAVAAAILFSLQVLFYVAGGAWFSFQAAQQEKQVNALFQEIFPGTRQQADLQRQLKGYLNQGGSGESGYQAKIQLLSSSWNSVPGLVLESLRYDANRNEMVIQLKAKSLSDLDKVVSRLGQGSHQVELMAANELERGVLGRIRIR
ncbi:type II secretion system protein GspL [Biformimicrobium ophioploci]|uniref:Type II secretion system protein L n=1 Tax=Biformimicrobium ophioploci TaxID=3036711 RepID=A0ABQ6M1U3_9GAMM|nr:type II secretion system protein GspL [Microbulbifer sp. NKW57]GMG88235.1 hypothetical protein MNKW57_25560 [Microbulbifer sp. NKW57]